MSSKISEFNFNILLITSFILHNKMKYPKAKSSFKIKLNKLATAAKASPEEIEYTFLYLVRQGIIYTENEFLFINLDLIKNLLKKEYKKKENTKSIIIQPNFELLVKPEISLSSLFNLIQFSEFKKKDVIYKFKITPNSLHNAYILKWNSSKIIKFLSENSENPVPENITFLINEVYERSGELKLGVAGCFLTGKKFVIQQIKEDENLKKLILKEISPTLLLIDSRISINELFFILKEKQFYPQIEKEKIYSNADEFIIYFTQEEVKNFYAAILTLKEIGFEHKLSVNFNLLNNLIDKVEKKLKNKLLLKSKAVDEAIKYQQELKKSIKKYVLKTVEANLKTPKILVTNRIAEQYKGENPATKIREMKKMIEYAIKNKIFLIIKVYTPSAREKYVEYLIEPRYLYENRLYGYVKELKEEQSFELKKISFIMLPGI